MLSSLEGRVAVVTGAGSGIGAAMARRFATEGMSVVAADIDLGSVDEVVAELDDAVAVRVDVADAQSVEQLAVVVHDTFGRVDLLCNNAGVFQGGLAWERSVADWDWALGVNLYGIVHAIRSFVPRMIDAGTEAHIVNTSSVAAFVSGPLSSPYVVSKCAAFSLSECLAHDLAAVGSAVGVSVLTPSAIDTGIASTSRVRPDRFGVDTTEDAAVSAGFLAEMVAAGLDPDDVMEPVLDAVRTGTFLVPTRPSWAEQLRSRHEDLSAQRLPRLPDVD